jgi:hypothetical protein
MSKILFLAHLFVSRSFLWLLPFHVYKLPVDITPNAKKVLYVNDMKIQDWRVGWSQWSGRSSRFWPNGRYCRYLWSRIMLSGSSSTLVVSMGAGSQSYKPHLSHSGNWWKARLFKPIWSARERGLVTRSLLARKPRNTEDRVHPIKKEAVRLYAFALGGQWVILKQDGYLSGMGHCRLLHLWAKFQLISKVVSLTST